MQIVGDEKDATVNLCNPHSTRIVSQLQKGEGNGLVCKFS